MTNQLLTYTLITGAGAGLGKEFARQCAASGRNLLLLALLGSGIASVATQLEWEYAIRAVAVEVDLSDIDQLQAVIPPLLEAYPVDFLLNNAGIGGTSPIAGSSIDMIGRIIQLNVRGTAMLTRMLIPYLLKHPSSFILNVSSMAAFTPIAYKTVYPASKAFISSFSLGLREELAGTGISVSVVYPGPIMTNSNTSRRILAQGLKARLGLLSTAAIAFFALKKTWEGEPVIIPGVMNRINQRLMYWLPSGWKLRMVSREVKKEIALG